MSIIRREWRSLLYLMVVPLFAGCSQNYSEEGVDQALKEQGLRAVGGQTSRAVKTPEPGQQGARKSIGGLSVITPESWEEVQPSSSMRVAEYQLKAEGGEAVLAVFYFGQGQGGAVQANIDRWIAQFKQPDGSDSRSVARQWNDEVAGMPISMVEVTGTYSVGMMSGGSGEPLANYRMLGAIVESAKGPFFFKFTGPSPIIVQELDHFTQYIKSIQPE